MSRHSPTVLRNRPGLFRWKGAASTVEYAILLLCIVLVAIGAVTLAGSEVSRIVGTGKSSLVAAAPSETAPDGPSEPPQGVDDAFDIGAEGERAIPFATLLANDRGRGLRIVGIFDETGGSFTFDAAEGVVLADLTSNSGDPAGFSYRIEDSEGRVSEARVTLNVRIVANYVLVGEDGLATSEDGKRFFRRQEQPTGERYVGVAYGNGLWMTLSRTGRVWTSTDGIDWTEAPRISTSFTPAVYPLSFRGDEFLVVGKEGTRIVLWHGTDPKSLQRIDTGIDRSSTPKRGFLTHLGPAFLYGSTLFVNADGQNWTQNTIPGGCIADAVYDGLRFYSPYFYNAAPSENAFCSSTGVSVWETLTNPGGMISRAASIGTGQGNGLLVGSYQPGQLYFSILGMGGGTITVAAPNDIVAWDGRIFRAGGRWYVFSAGYEGIIESDSASSFESVILPPGTSRWEYVAGKS